MQSWSMDKTLRESSLQLILVGEYTYTVFCFEWLLLPKSYLTLLYSSLNKLSNSIDFTAGIKVVRFRVLDLVFLLNYW